MCEKNKGRDSLWLWFGLSHSSWLTLPRVMMHEMPDDWQARMAELLNEWDATWVNQPNITTSVNIRSNGRFVRVEALNNYRHPDRPFFKSMKEKL